MQSVKFTTNDGSDRLVFYFYYDLNFIIFNRYYENADEKAISKVVRFNPGPQYKPADREGSYDEHGDRGSRFGTNVYDFFFFILIIVSNFF